MTDHPTATVDLLQVVYDNTTDRVIAVDPLWPVLETPERVLDGQDGHPDGPPPLGGGAGSIDTTYK